MSFMINWLIEFLDPSVDGVHRYIMAAYTFEGALRKFKGLYPESDVLDLKVFKETENYVK